MFRSIGIFLGVAAVLTPIGGSDAGGVAMARYVEHLDIPTIHWTAEWWLTPGQIVVISLCLAVLCVLSGIQRRQAEKA